MNCDLHIKTPLVESPTLSKIVGRKVLLKLENLQPSGSFKIRGIGRTMQEAVASGVTQFLGSSGGNAGMAMAVAARKMGKPATIFIPNSTVPFMVEKIKSEGANVIVAGDNWDEANSAAVSANSAPGTFLVHPFGQPTTWQGHSTLVDELVDQLGEEVPACLVTCVGGGGLALGLLQGMDRAGWAGVKLVTMETEGANCLVAARRAGQVVTLEAIRSVAGSLGALAVQEELFHYCQEQPGRVLSHEVPDAAALSACLDLATAHRILVEPACGAVLSAAYTGLLATMDLPKGPVVIVVCGGNIVNLELLQKWRESLNK